MYIQLMKTMPNYAVTEFHTIRSMEITQFGVNVTINSYNAMGDGLIAWQSLETVPHTVLTADPYKSIAEYLIAPNGFLGGGSIVVDTTELDKLRNTLYTRINGLRDANIAAGCDTPSGRVDSDEVSIRNILGAVQVASLSMASSQPFQMVWRYADNTTKTLDAMGVVGVGLAVMGHVQHCYARSWELKEAVNDPDATMEELNAIDFSTGWVAEVTPEVTEDEAPVEDTTTT